jgi:FixJ family two-component response regulator
MNAAGPVIFVVDDDTDARASVAATIQSRGFPVREYASAEEFLEKYDGTEHGCLIVDVRMTGLSGIELLQRLKETNRMLPSIVITAHSGVQTAVKAMQAGAFTFLEKPTQPNELWQNIAAALQIQVAETARQERIRNLREKFDTLTPDENSVLRKLLEGQPNKRIASDLDIGLRTVELRRSNIMKKTGANSLAELVRMSIELGIEV